MIGALIILGVVVIAMAVAVWLAFRRFGGDGNHGGYDE